MKKITLLVASIFMIGTAQAQMTLSESVDPTDASVGGVACWDNVGGEYRDNAFARTYDLATDYSINTAWEISAVEFGQGSGGEGKVMTINVWSIPERELNELAPEDFELLGTADVTITAANDGTIVTAPVSAVVPAGTLIAIEVFAPDEDTATGLTFFPGFNTAGQNSTAWLRSDGTGTGGAQTGCGIPWSDSNTIVADPQEYVINIVGDVAASTNEVALSQVSIFPNPATDVLNIQVPGSVEINAVALYDILGKEVVSTVSNGQVNVSDLSRGVYMLNVQTTAGSLTEKVIIE